MTICRRCKQDREGLICSHCIDKILQWGDDVTAAACELVEAMCTDCPARDKCIGWGVCHRIPVVGQWMVKLRTKVEETS